MTFPSFFKKYSLFGICALAFLGACDQLTIVDKVNDPESKWDDILKSSKNIKLLNQTVGKPNGIPRPIKRLGSRLGRVNTERMTAIRLRISGSPTVLRRYVTLHYLDDTKEEGVLVQESQGIYAPYIVRWIPNSAIVEALKAHDALQSNAAIGMKWAHPDFNDPLLNLCVGRVTAEGLPEEFPYQAWAYCSDPKSKKDLTPRYMPIFRETTWGT